jgi:hypothetical protein
MVPVGETAGNNLFQSRAGQCSWSHGLRSYSVCVQCVRGAGLVTTQTGVQWEDADTLRVPVLVTSPPPSAKQAQL